MVNPEVTYERDINRSYMKIPAVAEATLDEKLMFLKKYQGILPVEKCYVNGCGQYWYNISGRQALDTYCKVNSLNHGFFETLILRICSQLELLEWNLVDANCLVIDPELIFVNHSGDEISFILYPDEKGNFMEELRRLMEYLLTKLNHGDKEGVHQAYHIYDMILSEGYSIADLKQAILSKRGEELQEKAALDVEPELVTIPEREEMQENPRGKLTVFLEWLKHVVSRKRENKETIPIVVYPEDELEEKSGTIHPTVCLAATLGEANGVLIYEGTGDYPDFHLEQGISMLGKNPRVKLHIDRETISQFHAKFDYFDKNYYVEDMNSTNGTFVNDEMLNYKEKRCLSPGDVLRFADVKYRFL